MPLRYSLTFIYLPVSLAFPFLVAILVSNIHIYVEEGKSVVISWTTKVDQPNYNVVFNQLSSQTDDLIYAQGILQKNSARYKDLIKTGLHIQFTLTQVNELDVGLYKSMFICMQLPVRIDTILHREEQMMDVVKKTPNI
jgi:hypothetical protein